MVTESMTQSEHMLCLLEKELNAFNHAVRIIHLAQLRERLEIRTFASMGRTGNPRDAGYSHHRG